MGKKVSTNFTIDEEVIKEIKKLASKELSNTTISKSLMTEILIKEAIEARNKK